MVLLLLTIIVLLMLFSKKSKYSGNEGVPDLTGWTLSSQHVTRDEIGELVYPAVNFFKEKTGLCVFPIKTNILDKYTSTEDPIPLYKVRFMFSTTSTGFPYGLGCTFYIKNKVVIGYQTQQVTSSETYTHADDKFLSYDTIVSERNKRILSPF